MIEALPPASARSAVLGRASSETYTRAVKRFFAAWRAAARLREPGFEGIGPVHRAAERSCPCPPRRNARAAGRARHSHAHGLRDRAILETAYSTGARLEELTAPASLATSTWPSGTVRLMGKGSRERVVPLGAAAVEWIRKYLAEVRPRQAKPGTTALWVTARRQSTRLPGRLGWHPHVRPQGRNRDPDHAPRPAPGLRHAHAPARRPPRADPDAARPRQSQAPEPVPARLVPRAASAMHERSRLGQ